ncbi:hypothetical protein [Pedobacter sp. FW305-3-2-15-E-R2A2]|uniref:hypothetical protein n=1 Tax=Pedobacter sp. FW305-3-2-15-E-R2A2 TaxID=3140251 RepID=UPI00314082C3
MDSKLKSIKNSVTKTGIINDPLKSEKKNALICSDKVNPNSTRMTEIIKNYREQTESIKLIAEILENMSDLINTINYNLHSIIGVREEKNKTKNRLSKEERISKIKNILLFGGRTTFHRKGIKGDIRKIQNKGKNSN